MSGQVMDLVSRTHLRFKRRVARGLLPHGIAPKQIHVLRRLEESGGLSPSQVAELVFADRPTATSLLNTLERAGWVRRRAHPEDGRQVLVEITAQGRRKLASVPVELWRSGRTAVDPEASLSPSERKQLVRLLEKLNAALDEADGGSER